MANLKLSAAQYRRGGQRVLWIDGRGDDVTREVVADIRAKGFRCWRAKDRVWVEADSIAKMDAAKVDTGDRN